MRRCAAAHNTALCHSGRFGFSAVINRCRQHASQLHTIHNRENAFRPPDRRPRHALWHARAFTHTHTHTNTIPAHMHVNTHAQKHAGANARASARTCKRAHARIHGNTRTTHAHLRTVAYECIKRTPADRYPPTDPPTMHYAAHRVQKASTRSHCRGTAANGSFSVCLAKAAR
jgi:hypothetical protein